MPDTAAEGPAVEHGVVRPGLRGELRAPGVFTPRSAGGRASARFQGESAEEVQRGDAALAEDAGGTVCEGDRDLVVQVRRAEAGGDVEIREPVRIDQRVPVVDGDLPVGHRHILSAPDVRLGGQAVEHGVRQAAAHAVGLEQDDAPPAPVDPAEDPTTPFRGPSHRAPLTLGGTCFGHLFTTSRLRPGDRPDAD